MTLMLIIGFIRMVRQSGKKVANKENESRCVNDETDNSRVKWSDEQVVFLAKLFKVKSNICVTDVRGWRPATDYQNRLKIRRSLQDFKINEDFTKIDLIVFTNERHLEIVHQLRLDEIRKSKNHSAFLKFDDVCVTLGCNTHVVLFFFV